MANPLLTAIDAYLAERAAGDLAARSVAHHRYLLRRAAAMLAQQGHRRWASVRGTDLDAVILELADQELSRCTLDAYAWSLRGFGAWLARTGAVLRDPAANLAVRSDDEMPLPPPPLSEAQVVALIDSVPRHTVVDLRTRLHLELLYACGLRNIEAVHLDVADLDLRERTLLVREGKGGRTRIAIVLASLRAAAEEYLAVRRLLLKGPDHGALLLSPTGRRLGGWWMQRWLAGQSQRLGVRVHPHLLRHSIAVHLLQRGADVRHIQDFLGHRSLDTTKIYLRLVAGHLREAYDTAMPVLYQDGAAS